MRRRRVLFAIVAVPVLLLGIGLALIPRSIGCGSRTVRVLARLVTSETGVPIEGIEVMTVPSRSWAHEVDKITFYRTRADDVRVEQLRRSRAGLPPLEPYLTAELCASARTGPDGRFDVLVSVPWSSSDIGGIRLGRRDPPARSGVEALRIDPADGRAPVVIDVPEGKWDYAPVPREYGDVWATWDLGDVRVDTAQ